MQKVPKSAIGADASGTTQSLLQQREPEKIRCILEGSKESVKNEFKGEKIDGGLESYLTLSFFDLDKNTGRGQFAIDWVEGTMNFLLFLNSQIIRPVLEKQPEKL